jgi:signal transduction histidine kinase
VSIRLKAALILALAVAATTAAASCVFIVLERRSTRAAEEEKVGLLAANVRAMARESQLARDPLMLIDYLAFLRRERRELVRARARFDGRWAGPEPDPLPKDQALRSETVTAPAGASPEILVELVFSRRELEAAAAAAHAAMTRDLTAAAALVLLLGVLISVPLSLRLTSRLVEIERAMKDIGEGRLDGAIPDAGNDELARLARGLNAMAGRLKELDAMKRIFTASVTHELRSPLFAIESYVKELLRESKGLESEDRRRLERVLANAGRLAHFVTSLLDMARIERGQLEYRPRGADLAGLIEDAVEFQRARAEERGLALSVSAEQGLPPMRLDPDLITQVAANLVANAINFTRRGGTVVVTVRRQDAEIEVAVADTGIGVPAETLARLFRPFERGADPLRAGGSGLGLSISKAAIERHGGRIGAESEPGRGSRFWFVLPLDNKSLTPRPIS